MFGNLRAERSSVLTVRNHSTVAICAVYLGEGDRRGPNWLRGRETIDPDAARAFVVAAGTYALRMDDCEGRVLFARNAYRVRGTMRLDFRAVEVERRERVGTRRFARGDGLGSPGRQVF